MGKITVTLSTDTHAELEKLGTKTQTYDDIVSDLIKHRKNHHE